MLETFVFGASVIECLRYPGLSMMATERQVFKLIHSCKQLKHLTVEVGSCAKRVAALASGESKHEQRGKDD